jgi:hypothetical protein
MIAALFALTLVVAAAGSRAGVSASIDRDRVALGDTLRLTITATDNEDLGKLDLTPLAQNFELLQRSTSSKTSIVNGRRSDTRELMIDMTPRREGNLEVPPLRLAGHSTDPLMVAVGPPPKTTAGGETVIFEAEVDRSSVYVQGQLILTLRLQQAINLDDRSITDLQLEDAFVRQLEQNSFQRTINGRPWLVHEIRYAIFPEQSGSLEIPAQTFTARESTPRRSLFDLGSSGRRVRRTSETLTVEVLPRPDGFPGTTWLPARSVTLEETWSTPPEQLRVGESATRTLTIRGEGLQGAQLPPVLFPATEGLKYYPDQPVISDSENATGLVGLRQDSVAVVPTSAGSWEIPELRIPWWDTETNELRYAVVPGRSLEAAPAAGSQPATPPAVSLPQQSVESPGGQLIPARDNGQSSLLWPVLAAVNGIGWLLTLGYLAWSRRRPAPVAAPASIAPTEKPAFKQLLAACIGSNPGQARQAVISWAAALFPEAGIVSLAQVARAFGNDQALSEALNKLDKALYSPGGDGWDGTGLADIARRLRSDHHRRADEQEPALQLYPTARRPQGSLPRQHLPQGA